MKRKIAIALALSVAAIVTLCSFTTRSEAVTEKETHTHICCEGSKCTGTVGCSCSGFSPITDGKEWQKSYCRKCGHHRSYHK